MKTRQICAWLGYEGSQLSAVFQASCRINL
jgi:hypothetical protein